MTPPPETDGAPPVPPDVSPATDAACPAPGAVVVIGAGPAGLTAAYQLTKAGVPCTVLEADGMVGGLSRSPERDGWRFDIGGHRFFTKVDKVADLWREILPGDDFLTRPRLSRIFYDGKYYDYPIRPLNALRNLGFAEALRAMASFLWVRIRPPVDQSTLEGYIASNYGWRLYRHFFETYNEKVWGVSARELSADWGAQRIKGMSLWAAVWEPVRDRILRHRTGSPRQTTSLIQQFHYPKYGPGMMWERCATLVEAGGSSVVMSSPVTTIRWGDCGVTEVTVNGPEGEVTYPSDHVISSMPISHLIQDMDPLPPMEVLDAAAGLRHRDFLTVALVVPVDEAFPDNWIYVHSPDVKVGRIQNFGAWSPYLVRGGHTCLGLEYFVFEDDDLWSCPDDELITMATKELSVLGLVGPDAVSDGYVVRMPRAYPVYDDAYARHVETLRTWLAEATPNVHPVGRNGMHKYNNQDHSMYTAMLTVENLLGADHDIWAVNVDDEYHEARHRRTDRPRGGVVGDGGGRAAPIVPNRNPA